MASYHTYQADLPLVKHENHIDLLRSLLLLLQIESDPAIRRVEIWRQARFRQLEKNVVLWQ